MCHDETQMTIERDKDRTTEIQSFLQLKMTWLVNKLKIIIAVIDSQTILSILSLQLNGLV